MFYNIFISVQDVIYQITKNWLKKIAKNKINEFRWNKLCDYKFYEKIKHRTLIVNENNV